MIKIEEIIAQTYEGFKKIGKGGFGVVYRGRHKLTKEYHAIKIQDSKRCKTKEVEMLHKYKHDSILPLVFSFITKSQRYTIYPLYENNLSYILKTQINIGLDRKIKYFQSILNGVYFLHSNNVMHLDLRPTKILVTKDGECVLKDFGLTQENDMGLITQFTRWVSIKYASPERENENVRSDFADDVWSLGCVLYEIFENGETINVPFIKEKTDWVQEGAKYFYDDIFLKTFVERSKRITLEEMLHNFKEISLVLLDDTHNLGQREIISNYLEEQSEPQPTFGRLLPIEEEKLEDGITEITQNDVKLDMKEENPFSCQEFKHKKHELSESCHSNLYPGGFFSDTQEDNVLYIYILLLVLITNYKRINLNYIKLKRMHQCTDPSYMKIGKGKIWPITKSMTLKNPVVDVSSSQQSYFRGNAKSLNSLNYYIAAPCRPYNCPNPHATMLFNLNDLNQQPTLIEEYSTSNLASECFFIHDYAAICCELTGYLQKYEFDSNMNLQPLPFRPRVVSPPWIFADIADNPLTSCIQMEEGLIVIGDKVGIIYVVDDAGYILASATPPTYAHAISQLAEVLQGVIMSVNRNVANGVIYDLRDINIQNHITSTNYHGVNTNAEYTDIISLVGGGEGYFALAGGIHWNCCAYSSCPCELGTITIGQLLPDLSINIIKSTGFNDYVGGDDCVFMAIHEIELGIVFVGGVKYCTEVCSWNYIDDPKPKCYSENEDIYNFISFCTI